MFETLSDRLTQVFSSLRGQGRLSAADIDATAREIRIALLEADVALPVVRQFIARVKERASGAEVSEALNPAQQVIKIVNEELVEILGGEARRLRFAKVPPTVIMLAGPPGIRQDDGRGQAGPVAAPAGQHPDAGRRRPAAAQRGPAAAGPRRARRRAGLRPVAGQRRRATRSRWPGRRSTRPSAGCRTSSSSTPRPAGHRRGDDAAGRRRSGTPSTRTRSCSWSTP